MTEEKNNIYGRFQSKAKEELKWRDLYDRIKLKYNVDDIELAAMQSAEVIAPTRPGTFHGDTRMQAVERGQALLPSGFSASRAESNGVEQLSRHQRGGESVHSSHSFEAGSMRPPIRPVRKPHSGKYGLKS